MYYIFSGIIGVLIILLILTLVKIRHLKNSLITESKKRLLPLFSLETKSDEAGIYLKNISYCYAKDIKIEDMEIVIDFGFKKRLLLKFDPIDDLREDETVKINFKIFDGEFEDRTTPPDNLVNYFRHSDFEMKINYSNVENVTFSEIISCDKENFYIKEAKASA